MRIVLISLAAAASALAVASPASAQYYGYPGYSAPGYSYGAPGYGYGAPGYGYGAPAFGYGYGQVRALQVRIQAIRQQIEMLDRRNILSNREARRLRDQSRTVEHSLVHANRNGLSPREARDIQTRIAGLEYRVRREAMDRNGRWGTNGRYNGNNQWQDQHGRWHYRND